MAKKRPRTSVFDAISKLEEEDDAVLLQRKQNTQTEKAKSQAAQAQTQIYNRLVECRILIQRALTAVNEEPEPKKAKKGGEDDAIKACNDLLSRLLKARHQLVHPTHDDKEEVDYKGELKKDSLSETLEAEYKECREEWKLVLNRRQHSVQLHTGSGKKFGKSLLDSSFWEQVESTIQHEQLRKSANRDDGVETFQDAKVYQHMLKEYVTANDESASAVDAAAARLHDKSSKLSSSKRNVDRRASKGRKLRYTPLAKLANFCFPVPRTSGSSALDEDEWFASLFGGVGNTKKNGEPREESVLP